MRITRRWMVLVIAGLVIAALAGVGRMSAQAPDDPVVRRIIELGTNYIPWAYLLPHTSWSVPRGKKPWVEISSAGLGKPDPLAKLGPHHGNVAALKDLIAAVASDGKPQADLADARAGLEMIVGVFESHRQGTAVSFPLSNRQDPLALL